MRGLRCHVFSAFCAPVPYSLSTKLYFKFFGIIKRFYGPSKQAAVQEEPIIEGGSSYFYLCSSSFGCCCIVGLIYPITVPFWLFILFILFYLIKSSQKQQGRAKKSNDPRTARKKI